MEKDACQACMVVVLSSARTVFCTANVDLPAEMLTSRPFSLQHPDMKGPWEVSIAELHGRTWRAAPPL